jgi:hypothetical protein
VGWAAPPLSQKKKILLSFLPSICYNPHSAVRVKIFTALSRSQFDRSCFIFGQQKKGYSKIIAKKVCFTWEQVVGLSVYLTKYKLWDCTDHNI